MAAEAATTATAAIAVGGVAVVGAAAGGAAEARAAGLELLVGGEEERCTRG